ncbi:hypothetical protein E5082_19895 [Streptomyces griseoluteus]|uniref:Tetratricopeptide repeat protein n=1 Tax=Streptomyces griseoluteus TaxID=29306 RepID=A0A4Z1DF29_STRGP|nr:hypothetical protein [Streptomyces griseoluteus]TGN80660.1 hypothetical protein E5082_19895 [Streptomyces griseoluteus]GHF21776.1 hypothetical protein GCM10017776_44910 [Streptomyces griseoluteus]
MPLTPPPPVTDRAPSDPPGGLAPEHSGTFDAALGDAELLAARAALGQGRWQSARSLLLHTGDEWDRRGHRVTVLAAGPGAHSLAGQWLLAEPGSADAATLLALALVHRALRGEGDPEHARASCRTAAGLAPADPTPWLGLLLLARALGPEAELTAAFKELRARHPEHHHGHHLLIAGLAERPPGGPESHEAYDTAERAAAEAPADSPLAVLPVVAYAERHRVLAAAGLAPAVPGPAPCAHWTGPRARRVLRAAFDWWLEWEHDEHPRRHLDLNHLAFAMSAAGRPAEAAALFHRIGPHATRAPWSYTGQDPSAAFHRARAHALATG